MRALALVPALIPALSGLGGCVAATTPAAPAAETDALDRLEARLAAQDSATAALAAICAARGLADPPVIRAAPVDGPALPPTPRNRMVLDVTAGEPVGYRHVRLSCGGVVMSEAHNWFVPARLPPEMREALASTDTPFGKVIAPLGFVRERMASSRGDLPGCPADTVLAQRAVLRLPDGRAVSTVIECYTAAALEAPLRP